MTSVAKAEFDSAFFEVKSTYIRLLASDSSARPSIPETRVTKDGLVSKVALDGDPECDRRKRKWKQKIGRCLGEQYLALEITGSRSEDDSGWPLTRFADPFTATRQYQLVDFPDNYVFYVKQRAKNPKSWDAHLRGGGHDWPSPQQFVRHAAWIMAGMPPEKCACNQCNRNVPQRYLNELLKRRKDKLRRKILKCKRNDRPIERRLNAVDNKAFLRISIPL